jgi:hypothetical protein
MAASAFGQIERTVELKPQSVYGCGEPSYSAVLVVGVGPERLLLETPVPVFPNRELRTVSLATKMSMAPSRLWWPNATYPKPPPIQGNGIALGVEGRVPGEEG